MALYKRPNSKYWWMKFYFDGELVQQSTKCSNKADARTVESAYRTQLALGKIGIKPKPKAPTFDKAVDDFLEWMKTEHGDQTGTYRRYYYSCQVLKRYFGKTKVNHIESKNVEDFVILRGSQISRKTGKKMERKSVNFDLFTLKLIFKRLFEANFLHTNPTRIVKQLPESISPFHVLSSDEEKRYLLACPQPLQDVAILMLETGMRPGEVYQLRRQDIFIDRGFLKVFKGKTASAIRNVYFTEKGKNVLVYRLNKFDGENLFPQNDVDGEKATKDIGNLHLQSVNNLGYGFRLYDCRHTFATRALEDGVDLITLAAMLGHKNLKMVMRYAHPSEEHKAGAIQRMETARSMKKAV